MTGKYDAIIVGSGPNGLAAAIYLQSKGLRTLVLEQSDIAGGAAQTRELTLPGFRHDIGSSIHPLAYDSPYFSTLPLEKYGLSWVHPDIAYAHPFEDGSCIAASPDLEETLSQLGPDRSNYGALYSKHLQRWPMIRKDLLSPLLIPGHFFKLMQFGRDAILSARSFTRSRFNEEKTRAFFYGAAAHSTLSMRAAGSAAFGLVLSILAHTTGWPFPEGGAARLTEALTGYYEASGGVLATGEKIEDLNQMPAHTCLLLDLTPRQVLGLANIRLTRLYRARLSRFQYGTGICKVDWALSEPIPFLSNICRKAGTVHIGFSTKEIEDSESLIQRDRVSDKPYVLLAQHSVFDPTRVPAGKHTAWAYCHIPWGSDLNMVDAMEQQIERAAPGFRDCILERSVKTSSEMQAWNPNLVGGDIGGGRQNLYQVLARPVLSLSPYRTSNPNIYICSSSTPPGGGVHGMCGYHAAERAYRDHFR